MRYRVYPYKQGSASAKLLADHLGGKVLRHASSIYVNKPSDVVVNWGSTNFPNNLYSNGSVLNPKITQAQNKLDCLKLLYQNNVSCPAFWCDRLDIPDDAYPVVCRKVLTGHSGHGIVISETPDDLVSAPLYTQYIKKKEEYRVHVLQGEVFFVQRKARKISHENPNWLVRNLSNGFVFLECDIDDVPEDVITQAESATVAVGVDFGGVDVIWNDKKQKAYVLEINTACGLEERTAKAYAEAFQNNFDT